MAEPQRKVAAERTGDSGAVPAPGAAVGIQGAFGREAGICQKLHLAGGLLLLRKWKTPAHPAAFRGRGPGGGGFPERAVCGQT